VAKNFNFESLKQESVPEFCPGKRAWMVSFKVNTANIRLVKIEAKWKEMSPTMPFNYTFLDGL
jgi:hypothetical protein